jgi:lipopolysaccharide biosynthesis glycosyltransferase
MIKGTSQILYLDIDTAFATSVESVWQYFDSFDGSQILGIVSDCDFPGCAYFYKHLLSYPVTGKFGLNTGVLFMKLDKMREFNFEGKMALILDRCLVNNIRLHVAEQDLVNILFASSSAGEFQVRLHYADLFYFNFSYNF